MSGRSGHAALRSPRQSGIQRSEDADAYALRVRRTGYRQVDDLRAALDQVAEHELVWVALRDPTGEEVGAVQEALEFSDEQAHRLLKQPSRAVSGGRRRAYARHAVCGQWRGG